MNSPVVATPNKSIENKLLSEKTTSSANEIAEQTATLAVSNEQTTEPIELCEDMEMIGPGQMLRDARELAGLSQNEVANRLNFRLLLVENIENEVFDSKLPATFNRGYLRNYAKLVSIDEQDVLASYDAFGAAHIQRTEMQSFSNLTVKQAQHSRLMWLSYFIVALLFGSTVVWWLQDTRQQNEQASSVVNRAVNSQQVTAKINSSPVTAKIDTQSSTAPNSRKVAQEKVAVGPDITVQVSPLAAATTLNESNRSIALSSLPVAVPPEDALSLSAQQAPEKALLSTAVFTFSGDCWVNIYDATGERIAWGVKKSGYVMTVSGKAPLRITLGKPELAEIVFDGQTVDMSPFNVGNIAKFTLPLTL